MKDYLQITIKNIKRLEKIPLNRFPWSIEMAFLTFNCDKAHGLNAFKNG